MEGRESRLRRLSVGYLKHKEDNRIELDRRQKLWGVRDQRIM